MKMKVMQALGDLITQIATAHGETRPKVRVSRPRRHRLDLAPVGQRGVSLTPAEHRAVCLGIYRPKLPPRGMPAPGRLFKGHRP